MKIIIEAGVEAWLSLAIIVDYFKMTSAELLWNGRFIVDREDSELEKY